MVAVSAELKQENKTRYRHSLPISRQSAEKAPNQNQSRRRAALYTPQGNPVAYDVLMIGNPVARLDCSEQSRKQ